MIHFLKAALGYLNVYFAGFVESDGFPEFYFPFSHLLECLRSLRPLVSSSPSSSYLQADFPQPSVSFAQDKPCSGCTRKRHGWGKKGLALTITASMKNT